MIKTVTPEAVNVKNKKTGTTNGKDWTLWPVGVAVQGTWYNGAVFNQDDLDYIQKDKPCVLDFYQEEYKGQMQWKFKIPNQTQQLLARVEALEEIVFSGVWKPKAVSAPEQNNERVKVEPKPYNANDPIDDLPF